MPDQVVVTFTMDQAEALLRHFQTPRLQHLSDVLLEALDAIESTIVNEHDEP